MMELANDDIDFIYLRKNVAWEEVQCGTLHKIYKISEYLCSEKGRKRPCNMKRFSESTVYESIFHTERITRDPENVKHRSDFQKGGSIFSHCMKTVQLYDLQMEIYKWKLLYICDKIFKFSVLAL